MNNKFFSANYGGKFSCGTFEWSSIDRLKLMCTTYTSEPVGLRVYHILSQSVLPRWIYLSDISASILNLYILFWLQKRLAGSVLRDASLGIAAFVADLLQARFKQPSLKMIRDVEQI